MSTVRNLIHICNKKLRGMVHSKSEVWTRWTIGYHSALCKIISDERLANSTYDMYSVAIEQLHHTPFTCYSFSNWNWLLSKGDSQELPMTGFCQTCNVSPLLGLGKDLFQAWLFLFWVDHFFGRQPGCPVLSFAVQTCENASQIWKMSWLPWKRSLSLFLLQRCSDINIEISGWFPRESPPSILLRPLFRKCSDISLREGFSREISVPSLSMRRLLQRCSDIHTEIRGWSKRWVFWMSFPIMVEL